MLCPRGRTLATSERDRRRGDDGGTALPTEQPRLCGLCPLAVLLVEMPVLRLQQPRARPKRRRGALRRGVPDGTQPSRETHAWPQRRLHLLWWRHTLADEAGHRGRHPRCDCGELDGPAQLRGDARGQPDQRRGQPLHRLPSRRRQPGLAWRAGDERCRPEGARPVAHGGRGDEGRRHRRVDLRALFVRPDVRAAEPDGGRLARRAAGRH